MERLTTDNPKDNIENALNLFYIKDQWTWVRGGGPGPEYKDVSLYGFTRNLIKTHIPSADIPDDDNELSAMMGEWLFDDVDSAEGTIATLYTAAWAYAELRHRLKAYEDTGLTPEEVKDMAENAETRLLTWFESQYGYSVGVLMDLLDAKKDGRLVVLPCRMDATVFDIRRFYKGRKIVRQEVVSGEIDHFTIGEAMKPIATVCLQGNEWADYEPDDLILTREEAETKLKEGGE